MTEATPGPHQTVEDALAARLAARRGDGSPLAEALRQLGAVDRAVYQAVARTPTDELDVPVRQLSDAADRSRLWLAIAAGMRWPGAAAAAGRRWRGCWRSARPRPPSTWA